MATIFRCSLSVSSNSRFVPYKRLVCLSFTNCSDLSKFCPRSKFRSCVERIIEQPLKQILACSLSTSFLILLHDFSVLTWSLHSLFCFLELIRTVIYNDHQQLSTGTLKSPGLAMTRITEICSVYSRQE